MSEQKKVDDFLQELFNLWVEMKKKQQEDDATYFEWVRQTALLYFGDQYNSCDEMRARVWNSPWLGQDELFNMIEDRVEEDDDEYFLEDFFDQSRFVQDYLATLYGTWNEMSSSGGGATFEEWKREIWKRFYLPAI